MLSIRDLELYGTMGYLIVAVIVSFRVLMSSCPWKMRTQGQTLTLSNPWSRRLCGYMFAGFFISAPLLLAHMDAERYHPLSASDTGAFVLFWCVCLGIAVPMLYLAAPETTVFDLSQRTFRFNRLWPSGNSHFSGPMSEIDGMVVKRFSGRGGTYYYVRIGWVVPGRPNVTLGIFSDENTARQEAYRLEQMLRSSEQDGASPAPTSSPPWRHLSS